MEQRRPRDNRNDRLMPEETSKIRQQRDEERDKRNMNPRAHDQEWQEFKTRQGPRRSLEEVERARVILRTPLCLRKRMREAMLFGFIRISGVEGKEDETMEELKLVRLDGMVPFVSVAKFNRKELPFEVPLSEKVNLVQRDGNRK
ncbi:hypothetical protein L1987_64042 [Smallanthus sonchifolius]|uniref:Uncharacterized protein n=1 Tax=Smallanthus sonchifolius TaxID=185202 RepID=A0ACB9CEV3_9ASTR|nr:hypothetical protein L1987_64042 [Smallanthus sonchifolius]